MSSPNVIMNKIEFLNSLKSALNLTLGRHNMGTAFRNDDPKAAEYQADVSHAIKGSDASTILEDIGKKIASIDFRATFETDSKALKQANGVINSLEAKYGSLGAMAKTVMDSQKTLANAVEAVNQKYDLGPSSVLTPSQTIEYNNNYVLTDENYTKNSGEPYPVDGVGQKVMNAMLTGEVNFNQSTAQFAQPGESVLPEESDLHKKIRLASNNNSYSVDLAKSPEAAAATADGRAVEREMSIRLSQMGGTIPDILNGRTSDPALEKVIYESLNMTHPGRRLSLAELHNAGMRYIMGGAELQNTVSEAVVNFQETIRQAANDAAELFGGSATPTNVQIDPEANRAATEQLDASPEAAAAIADGQAAASVGTAGLLGIGGMGGAFFNGSFNSNNPAVVNEVFTALGMPVPEGNPTSNQLDEAARRYYNADQQLKDDLMKIVENGGPIVTPELTPDQIQAANDAAELFGGNGDAAVVSDTPAPVPETPPEVQFTQPDVSTTEGMQQAIIDAGGDPGYTPPAPEVTPPPVDPEANQAATEQFNASPEAAADQAGGYITDEQIINGAFNTGSADLDESLRNAARTNLGNGMNVSDAIGQANSDWDAYATAQKQAELDAQSGAGEYAPTDEDYIRSHFQTGSIELDNSLTQQALDRYHSGEGSWQTVVANVDRDWNNYVAAQSPENAADQAGGYITDEQIISGAFNTGDAKLDQGLRDMALTNLGNGMNVSDAIGKANSDWNNFVAAEQAKSSGGGDGGGTPDPNVQPAIPAAPSEEPYINPDAPWL